MSDPIFVNGNSHSWGSIVAKVGGNPYYGFTDISYGDARVRAKGYSLGRHHAPVRRSRGRYEPDNAKVGGWIGAVQILREELQARAGGGLSYADVEFQFVVDFFEANEIPITIVLEGCLWAKNASSFSESTEGMKEEFEIDVMWISRNHTVLFDQSKAQIA